jgi:hypothetical protein
MRRRKPRFGEERLEMHSLEQAGRTGSGRRTEAALELMSSNTPLICSVVRGRGGRLALKRHSMGKVAFVSLAAEGAEEEQSYMIVTRYVHIKVRSQQVNERPIIHSLLQR